MTRPISNCALWMMWGRRPLLFGTPPPAAPLDEAHPRLILAADRLRRLVRLGMLGQITEVPLRQGDDFVVFYDPAGHPFCLCL